MRNIFINNYRKVVRDQTFVDQTDNLYHLNLRAIPLLRVRKAHTTWKRCTASSTHCHANTKFRSPCMFPVLNPRDSRKAGTSVRNRKEPYILHPPETTTRPERFCLINIPYKIHPWDKCICLMGWIFCPVRYFIRLTGQNHSYRETIISSSQIIGFTRQAPSTGSRERWRGYKRTLFYPKHTIRPG